VTEANGKTLQDLTVTEAVALIKGPADTKVVLKILRS
jgi:C-terminal processing protease CtpA/Prc